ncbi:MAG: ABC transporter ATP-binding protein [Candidatus Rokuibacteriota bacterium]
MSAALLELRGVAKAFGSLRVLDGLTLGVHEAEALGVIGPNGAGKTTALNIMIGRLRPDAGAVLLDGRDVTRMAPHARCQAGIALTHQIPHPFEAMTVYENVLVGATYGRGLSEREARAGAFEALELAGLAGQADVRAGTLSLVERKRLELGRALATAPRVLLLDEIAGGLGEGEIQEVVQVIGIVRARGVAIVWIEHIVHALRAVVDRLVAMDFGRTLMDGPPDAVMASPEVQRVYLGIDIE